MAPVFEKADECFSVEQLRNQVARKSELLLRRKFKSKLKYSENLSYLVLSDKIFLHVFQSWQHFPIIIWMLIVFKSKGSLYSNPAKCTSVLKFWLVRSLHSYLNGYLRSAICIMSVTVNKYTSIIITEQKFNQSSLLSNSLLVTFN